MVKDLFLRVVLLAETQDENSLSLARLRMGSSVRSSSGIKPTIKAQADVAAFRILPKIFRSFQVFDLLLLFLQLILFICHQIEQINRQLRHVFQQLLEIRLLAECREVVPKDPDGKRKVTRVREAGLGPECVGPEESSQLSLIAQAVDQSALSGFERRLQETRNLVLFRRRADRGVMAERC
jgi:hypothetical protein